MNPIVRYGGEASFALESTGNGLLVECGRPRLQPLHDCAAAVAEVLAKPLGYPPLAKITTEDDRIVLAVGSPLPRAAEIVAAVVSMLLESGVDPGGITVLQAKTSVDDACRLIPDDIKRQIRSAQHDVEDSNQMAYLATTAAGEPVVLNRLLTDADFILPIGCVQDTRANGYFGVNSAFFPTFSDKNTQSRFCDAQLSLDHQSEGSDDERGREADEVGWLLGVTFSIQVIPGSGDEVLRIVAGEIGKVRKRARSVFDDAWRHSIAARAKLVVATIEGGPHRQNWQNLARAIANATTLVEEGGAIAVVCELDEEPGPAVRHLSQARSRGEALDEILQNPPQDAPVAVQLARALERNHIYLMSRLDDSLLEDLEITPIASPEELNRLVSGVTGQGETCILLSNAQSANESICATSPK